MEQTTEMAEAGARILMVDDDPGIRDVVSDFLGRHGYRVENSGMYCACLLSFVQYFTLTCAFSIKSRLYVRSHPQ